MDASEKGRAFEREVYSILREVADKHPRHCRVIEQPRLRLHDGQAVIPDLDLHLDLLFEEARYLIECQDRKRSSAVIAQKIRYMKGLSDRNRVVFVYAEAIPKMTQRALSVDGVIQMSLAEFRVFAYRIALVLGRIHEKRTVRVLVSAHMAKALDVPESFELEVDTVDEVLAQLDINDRLVQIFVNNVQVHRYDLPRTLTDGDEVAVVAPISGG